MADVHGELMRAYGLTMLPGYDQRMGIPPHHLTPGTYPDELAARRR
jgi:hypothetical protein